MLKVEISYAQADEVNLGRWTSGGQARKQEKRETRKMNVPNPGPGLMCRPSSRA